MRNDARRTLRASRKELRNRASRVKAKGGNAERGLAVAEESEKTIAKFIALVRSYTEVAELTPEILNSFIDKIYIGKPKRIDG